MTAMLRVRRLALLLALACVGTMASATIAGAQTLTVDGQATCEGIGTQSFTLPQPLQTGQYWLDAGNSLWFQFYPDTDRIFFFTNSTIRITGVLASGGGKTLVWTIPDGGATGWPSLQAPDDPVNATPYALDGVTFCFNYHLYLNPNAYQTTARHWNWDIEKTGPITPLSLRAGQSHAASYVVTVTPAPGHVSYSVEGPVFVTNPTPYATTVEALTVTLQEMTDRDGNGILDSVAAIVTCPAVLPYTLAPYSQVSCAFATSLPDGDDRWVISDLVHDGMQGLTKSIEQLNFAGRELDECVNVFDSRAPGGQLGTACAADGAKTFAYSLTIGPFDTAGPFVLDNTATVVSIDTGTTFDSSTWSVTGTVTSPTPASVDECKNGGWQTFGVFKNQGQCVSSVTTGGKNSPGR